LIQIKAGDQKRVINILWNGMRFLAFQWSAMWRLPLSTRPASIPLNSAAATMMACGSMQVLGNRSIYNLPTGANGKPAEPLANILRLLSSKLLLWIGVHAGYSLCCGFICQCIGRICERAKRRNDSLGAPRPRTSRSIMRTMSRCGPQRLEPACRCAAVSYAQR